MLPIYLFPLVILLIGCGPSSAPIDSGAVETPPAESCEFEYGPLSSSFRDEFSSSDSAVFVELYKERTHLSFSCRDKKTEVLLSGTLANYDGPGIYDQKIPYTDSLSPTAFFEVGGQRYVPQIPEQGCWVQVREGPTAQEARANTKQAFTAIFYCQVADSQGNTFGIGKGWLRGRMGCMKKTAPGVLSPCSSDR